MEEEKMQQLGKSIIPLNAVPVQGSMVEELKAMRGSSGALDVKTFPNNPKEQERSDKNGQDLRVPVLNMRGEPLMRKLKLLEHARGVIGEVKRAIPPSTEVQGLHARTK